MKFTIQVGQAFDAFSNVLPHATSDAYLPVLSAVQVEVSGGLVTLAATDRYTLGVAELTAEDGAEDGSVLVPVAAVKDIVKMAKTAKIGFLTLSVEGDRVTATTPGESRTFITTDGQFPKWRSLWPDGLAPAEISRIGLGPAHLAKFARLQRNGRHDKSAALRLDFYAATKPVVVTVPTIENFRAIVMPVRLPDDSK